MRATADRAATRRKAIAGVALLGFVAAASCVLVLGYRSAHAPCSPRRLLDDPWDLSVYFARAQFFAHHTIPYRDVFSEYPTLATLAFAAPMLLVREARTDPVVYSFVWQCLMAACWLGVLILTARFRRDRGLSAWPALIMLSPGALYFSLMRFDILCALVVCTSLAAFVSQRYRWAHFLLAVATFIKWYPALLFPVYLSFLLSNGSRLRAARAGTIFVATIAVLVAGTVLVCTWKGFLVPYRFHAGRGSQFFNLYWFLEHGGLRWTPAAWRMVGFAFLAAQFSIVLVLAFRRIRTTTEVFQYTILALWLFITFSKIDSPQWVLWLLPPALMVARRTSTLLALAALGVASYAVFPLAYDFFGPQAAVFRNTVLLKDAVLLAAVVLVLREPAVDPTNDPARESIVGPGAAPVLPATETPSG